MNNFLLKLLAIFALIVAVTACSASDTPQSAEETRTAQVSQNMAEAVRQVPAPAISNFQQLRWQTYLYELQDQEIVTYSYFADMTGKLHLICESVGYGMSASIQITNPERVHMGRWSEQGMVTVPQPEPNGLYMPEGLSATWILCSDGEGGIRPVYWEPELIVTPFPLRHQGDIRAANAG